MKTVLTNFLILYFLPRVKMVKYHAHALIAVIKYGLIGRRLERISNVSGLLKATGLHLLFPNLASGPAEFVKKYKGFIINGFRFHTKDLE
ncbi:hypothetical protein Hdeb2414_s0008g00283941 [Helianthus debilis subsp. tardiflorus]